MTIIHFHITNNLNTNFKDRIKHYLIWLSVHFFHCFAISHNLKCIFLQNINTTTPLFTVTGLKTNTKYRFYVIARNAFGTSLPSSVVTVNVSSVAWDGSRIEGLPSSPHSIEISQTGADFLTLSWTAPTISHHEDEHKYR